MFVTHSPTHPLQNGHCLTMTLPHAMTIQTFYFQVANITAPIDARILQKIKSLCEEGITEVGEVTRHCRLLVKEIFLGRQLPDEFNRRYYPSRRDISQVVYRAKTSLACGLTDVDALGCYLDNVDGHVHWKPPSLGEQELQLVYQTAWQQQLLKRYGNHLCLLDATYRTVKYTLPFYQLVVKTNAEYVAVATIYLQRENTASLQAALAVVQSWNPEWQPSTFLIDCDDAEEAAVCTLFPGNLG